MSIAVCTISWRTCLNKWLTVLLCCSNPLVVVSHITGQIIMEPWRMKSIVVVFISFLLFGSNLLLIIHDQRSHIANLFFISVFCNCFTELFELNSLVNAIVLLILSMINMFFTFMSLLALAQSCGMLRPWNGATYHPLKNLTPKN